MATIMVDDSENLEKAIKRFKRMVEKEGIIREFKKRGCEKFFWKSVDMGFGLRIIRSRSPLRGCEASG